MVQGVGFRYFAMRQANTFGLTGYVKNMRDGSVELEVEGERINVENFKSILEHGSGYSVVKRVDINYGEYSAKYDKFSVEY